MQQYHPINKLILFQATVLPFNVILDQGQHGQMSCILVWIMPQVQDQSLDQHTTTVPQGHGKIPWLSIAINSPNNGKQWLKDFQIAHWQQSRRDPCCIGKHIASIWLLIAPFWYDYSDTLVPQYLLRLPVSWDEVVRWNISRLLMRNDSWFHCAHILQ